MMLVSSDPTKEACSCLTSNATSASTLKQRHSVQDLNWLQVPWPIAEGAGTHHPTVVHRYVGPQSCGIPARVSSSGPPASKKGVHRRIRQRLERSMSSREVSRRPRKASPICWFEQIGEQVEVSPLRWDPLPEALTQRVRTGSYGLDPLRFAVAVGVATTRAGACSSGYSKICHL
jgi:hypothetical protein